MKLVKIDGQDYDFEKMSADAKAQFASVQAADAKLNELRRDTAITVTARNMYIQALKKELVNISSENVDSDTSTKSGKSKK
jgi:hypothetical protein